MKKAGNNSFLKEYNRMNILNIIRLNKTISKIEISKLTGLSPTASGKIVNSLIEEGYIKESFEGESSGGRKPMMLSLDTDSYYSMGIDIEPLRIKFLIINLAGESVYEKTIKNSPENDFKLMQSTLRTHIRSITDKLDITEKLLGIGVSIPALVNKKKDILLAPNLPWDRIAHEELQKLSYSDQLSVDIINEAKASAIYESFMGACTYEKDFICVNISSGIGSGIYTDGKLYTGSGGMAGEIGHILVEEDGELCGCGRRGCLETVASIKSIKKEIVKGIEEGKILEKLDNKNGEIEIEEITVLARHNNSYVLEVLEKSGWYLGKALSYLVDIINPSKIILGKDFSLYGDLLLEEIREIVDKIAVSSLREGLSIEISKNGENSSVHGASLIPLKRLMGVY